MTTLVTIDETSGVQNIQTGVTSNDTAAPLPALFQAALTSEGAGTLLGAALSGVDGTPANAAGVNVLAFGAGVADVGFTDGSGNALDGADSGLTTTDGTTIYLYTSSFNNNVVVGRAGLGGAVVFACYLDTGTDNGTGDPGATGAKLWLAQYASMQQPDGSDANDLVYLSGVLNVGVATLSNFSLEGAPSGQNLFLMFGDGTPSADDAAIIATGKHPANQSAGASITTGDTVNSGQGGGMTTLGSNNQMIDPNEGMYFTFVKGANTSYTVPNLDQTEADVEANIDFASYFGVSSASFVMAQLQPPKLATLKISAFDNTDASEVGAAYVDGLGDADDVAVNIGAVTITRLVKVGKALVPTDYSFTEGGGTSQGGITVDFSGDTVVVTGTQAGDRITYTTDAQHNRVLVDNVGNSNAKYNAAFDIGGFRIASSNVTVAALDDLAFVDDGPTADAVLGTGTVAHDETAGVQADADDTANAGVAALFAAVGNASGQMAAGYAQGGASAVNASGSGGGADGLDGTAYALDVASAGVDSGLDTADGHDILLYLEGGLVVGRISGGADDGKAAFAVAIDSASGVLSMAQYNAVKHPTTDADESLSIAVGALLGVATVTDGDGDQHAASVGIGASVSFQDDGPGAFTPDTMALSNDGADSATEPLNAAGIVGADALGGARFVDTNASDDYLYASDGTTQLTSGGEKIVLSGYGTASLTATTESSLQAIFTATLDAAGDQYTITMAGMIDDGSAPTSLLGAAPVRSGNPTFNLVNDVGGTDLDLLFSARNNAGVTSVNVSTTGAGAGNQTMNIGAAGAPGEMLRIDFANNASLAGSPLGSDFVAGTHETINDFAFLVSQNTPSGTTGAVLIKAWDADNDKVLFGDPDDTLDTITVVKVNDVVVYDHGSTFSTMVNGRMVSAIAFDGGVIVTGLNEGQTGDGTGGDDPMVTVHTETGYNRVEMTNYGGVTVNGAVLPGTDFDIAPAGVFQGQPGNAVDFTLPVQVVDADGDLSPVELIGVTMEPLPV
jgi:hypothetical protein